MLNSGPNWDHAPSGSRGIPSPWYTLCFYISLPVLSDGYYNVAAIYISCGKTDLAKLLIPSASWAWAKQVLQPLAVSAKLGGWKPRGQSKKGPICISLLFHCRWLRCKYICFLMSRRLKDLLTSKVRRAYWKEMNTATCWWKDRHTLGMD